MSKWEEKKHESPYLKGIMEEYEKHGDLAVFLDAIERLVTENTWLYGKLNQISGVIEKGRKEAKRFE